MAGGRAEPGGGRRFHPDAEGVAPGAALTLRTDRCYRSTTRAARGRPTVHERFRPVNTGANRECGWLWPT